TATIGRLLSLLLVSERRLAYQAPAPVGRGLGVRAHCKRTIQLSFPPSLVGNLEQKRQWFLNLSQLCPHPSPLPRGEGVIYKFLATDHRNLIFSNEGQRC